MCSLPWMSVITHLVKKSLTLQNQTDIPCLGSVLYSLHFYILYSWFPYIQQSITHAHKGVRMVQTLMKIAMKIVSWWPSVTLSSQTFWVLNLSTWWEDNLLKQLVTVSFGIISCSSFVVICDVVFHYKTSTTDNSFILIYIQQDATLHSLFYLETALRVGWRYHPKHVEQFPDKRNCVTLLLVVYILEYYYDARTHEC